MKQLVLTVLAMPLCLAQVPAASTGEIVRFDPGLDAIVSATTPIEKVATGFKYLEAPLWRPSGVLWFSDLSGNILYQWSPDGKVTELLNPGGHDPGESHEGPYIGPNGLLNGPNNTVILCQHGARRIVSVAPDLKLTTLLDHFDGKRLNSPNDLVYGPDGALYFTDPPYGLPKQNNDPAKELKFNGVFRYAQGKLETILTDIPVPNGIGFSPEGKFLYLSNSQSNPNNRTILRCDFAAGAASNCRIFADISSSPERGVPDGMKIDSAGNVYSAGPGGVWVFSAEGKHLGTIRTPEKPSNCTWGDDGKTLYITAVTSVYRVRLKVAGEKARYD